MAKTKQFGAQRGADGKAQESVRQRTPSSAPPPQDGAAVRGGIQVPVDARKTVMMQPFEAPSQAPKPGQDAPEIELVQHELPGDAPLDPRLILISETDSKRSAAFRVLRHHLLERGHPQVIAVSGPHERCGKTTTAINLALAFAESGRGKVLLVDGNLRRPEIAGIFRFVPPWCFAEQLAQHRDHPFLPWGFVEMAAHCLHIAAINPRSEVDHRLDAPAFAVAMERLRIANYDQIIVDCPPVLGTADVNLIQDAADGVLLCARTRQVTAREIRETVEQLTPTKILGTALLE